MTIRGIASFAAPGRRTKPVIGAANGGSMNDDCGSVRPAASTLSTSRRVRPPSAGSATAIQRRSRVVTARRSATTVAIIFCGARSGSSKVRSWLSALATTSRPPGRPAWGTTSKAVTGSGVSTTPRRVPSLAAARRIMPSAEAETSVVPSPGKPRAVIRSACPANSRPAAPVVASHVFTTAPAAVATSLPSGEPAITGVGPPADPCQAFTSRGRRHSFTSRNPPDASVSPEGSKARAPMTSRWATPGPGRASTT